LIQKGFNVISVDNNSRSTNRLLEGVAEITGKMINNYCVDLCDFEGVKRVFQTHKIDGVIHFAAFKSVDESVREPLLYYQNNLISQINILRCAELFGIKYFVFSSSCSVYGNADEMPVTENTPLKRAESPYGYTKQIGEDMIRDIALTSSTKFILLRYFNPAGAHISAKIGEIPYGRPSNLIPAITQFAAGKLPQLSVYGTNYKTRDGSCVRDFVHVSDIAHAHTLALQYLQMDEVESKVELFNLGTGNGVTVLEAIKAFEDVAGIKLNYQLADRRPGDVVAVYANNFRAKEILKWEPVFTLHEIMRTAWEWEKVINVKID
jgi:UDP-glucose 4-epimerase